MAMGEVFISKSCKTYKNTVKSNDFYPLSYFPKLSSLILVIAFFAYYLVFIHLSKYRLTTSQTRKTIFVSS